MGDRECDVLLLDDTRVTLKIQPSLWGHELFALIASRSVLHEKSYFGLSFVDQETGLDVWLDLESKVLDQFPKSRDTIYMTFEVKNYVDDITTLKEFTTQRLFFLQTVRLISMGKLLVDSNKSLTLAALALQALEGDFISESATRHHLDRLKLIPDETLVAQGSSLESCAEKVSEDYSTLRGMDERDAVLGFMGIVQELPQYGVQYYEVKDKKGLPWLLGVSRRGIAQYYFSDPVKPREQFMWSDIVNVQFHKKRFILDADPTNDSELVEGTRHRSLSIHDKRPLRKRRKAEESTHSFVWITPSPAFSSVMFRTVIQQHNFYISLQRRRDDSMRSKSSRRTSVASDADEASQASSVREIAIPAAASNVKQLISQASSISNIVPSKLDASFNSDSGHKSGSTDLSSDDAFGTLNRLEKRRRQLQLEIDRKEKMLARFEQQQQEYLLSMKGKTGSGSGSALQEVEESASFDEDSTSHEAERSTSAEKLSEHSVGGGQDSGSVDGDSDAESSAAGGSIQRKNDHRLSMWKSSELSGFGTVVAVDTGTPQRAEDEAPDSPEYLDVEPSVGTAAANGSEQGSRANSESVADDAETSNDAGNGTINAEMNDSASPDSRGSPVRGLRRRASSISFYETCEEDMENLRISFV